MNWLHIQVKHEEKCSSLEKGATEGEWVTFTSLARLMVSPKAPVRSGPLQEEELIQTLIIEKLRLQYCYNTCFISSDFFLKKLYIFLNN